MAALPNASEYELEVHAGHVARVTELLTQVAATPKDARPPVQEWDTLLGPLFYLLLSKGDDIDRYVLAEIWSKVLLEAGVLDGYLRATTSVAASARDFYRMEEALEACRQGREAAGDRASASFANLINVEGILLVYRGDFEGAERAFLEAEAMAEGLHEEDFPPWTRVSKADYRNRVRLNLMEAYLRRGLAATGEERARYACLARRYLSTLEQESLNESHRNFLLVNAALLALVEGREGFARTLLLPLAGRGPGDTPENRPYLAVHARLLSVIATQEGQWEAAYHWIRKALREVIRYRRIGEEQDVLDQALNVLGGLEGRWKSESHRALVDDLVQLLEDKDWYTGRSHSRGVSSLSLRLGEVLNATSGHRLDLERLEAAGLLHDIGKLRTPWSLLNKLAPLGPREWDILRDHPRHGAEILGRIGMEDMAPIVKGHHEHLDGTGYPDGKPPDLLAAVVGAADAFEAATTPTRRYKIPKNPRVLLQEFSEDSGRRYHPEVVEAIRKIA
jgi:putative nucleotidyltransferase with HDIG domain